MGCTSWAPHAQYKSVQPFAGNRPCNLQRAWRPPTPYGHSGHLTLSRVIYTRDEPQPGKLRFACGLCSGVKQENETCEIFTPEWNQLIKRYYHTRNQFTSVNSTVGQKNYAWYATKMLNFCVCKRLEDICGWKWCPYKIN